MKRVITKLAVGAAALAAGYANAGVTVGGINFDASLLPGHLETTTLAETLILGNGQTLSGYGLVTTVNGVGNYCASGPCQLYFTFTNFLSSNFTGTHVDFTGGVLNIYRWDGTPINLTSTASATNYANIGVGAGWTNWAQLTGFELGAAGTPTLVADGTLLGSALSFTGQGLLEVNHGWGLASVEAFLDGNSELNTVGNGADLTITTSGSNSYAGIPAVDRGACWTGNPQRGGQFIGQAGDWCVQGTANTRGTAVIPEPASVALTGVALLALFGASRRRRNQQ
ncbi:MAG TPA: PEP-CTERM sorting domain-containing protein [Rubrivivax sp.]|nr:PEP-CTERM sorting domain-containing protein [Rubrivivax sp.]